MRKYKLSEGTESSVPSLKGIFYENGGFCRVSERDVRKVTDTCDLVENNVYSHARETAGGRAYFATDSAVLKITAYYPFYKNLGREMGAGKTGFDLYKNNTELVCTLDAPVPEFAKDLEFRAVAQTPWSFSWEIRTSGRMTDYTLYFPILTEIGEVELEIEDGSLMKENLSAPKGEPVVFYGSSITQGGKAPSPGASYVSTVMRALNKNYVNLGMWGSCHGERGMAECIAARPMSAFVLDFDHNDGAPHPFKERHFDVYKTVRDAHPEVPILMISRPNNQIGKDTAEAMKQAIIENYRTAREGGDKNVYFLDGESIMNYSTSEEFYGKDDKVHPIGGGHAMMAKVIGKAIAEMIK